MWKHAQLPGGPVPGGPVGPKYIKIYLCKYKLYQNKNV